jgi:hypothetical protein
MYVGQEMTFEVMQKGAKSETVEFADRFIDIFHNIQLSFPPVNSG